MKKKFVRGERNCCDDEGNTFEGEKTIEVFNRKGRKCKRIVCKTCEREVADYFIMARCGIHL